MKKKKRESRLKYFNPQDCSRKELYNYVFTRESFFKLYKTIHNLDKDKVMGKLECIYSHEDLYQFEEEIRLCHKAAILSGTKQTDSFNTYLVSLVELYFSNLFFSLKYEREVKVGDLSCGLPTSISYDWVLFSNILDRYQRYLLFEFLVLGYNIHELARRRYCTPRTIYNHFYIIISILNP